MLIIAFIAWHFFARTSASETPESVTHVQLASVSSLSDQAGPLQVTGDVTSMNHATVLAQSAGEIVHLYRALGDRVSAGDIIATFENSSQQAALVQAQGAYDAAQAALAKTTGANASNSTINSAQAAQSLENTQLSALTALQSAYASLDDAIRTKTDTLFSNPQSSPTLLPFTIPNNQLVVNIQNTRLSLAQTLNHAQALANASSSADIDATINSMIGDAQTVQDYLNNMVMAMNQAVPNQVQPAATIAAGQASAGAARSEVIGAITSLTSAKNAYDAGQASVQTTSNTAGSGLESDIAASQANVKSALGSLDAAQAALAKTIIRSPISGLIVSLPITQGTYISQFAQVAQISNPGALEVDSYVTSDDAKTLAIGGKAAISDSGTGVITFIAPALDPATGKIQVKIGLTGGESDLTDGETVSVSLDRSALGAKHAGASSSQNTITIPIAAAKITPTGPIVFTVSSSTLVAHAITLGSVISDRVNVVSGLTPEMDIVKDARGLTDGETVVVDQSN